MEDQRFGHGCEPTLYPFPSTRESQLLDLRCKNGGDARPACTPLSVVQSPSATYISETRRIASERKVRVKVTLDDVQSVNDGWASLAVTTRLDVSGGDIGRVEG